MDELPLEILVHIFRYLSKEEQIKVSEVNKKFRKALFTPTLWTEIEKRIEVPVSQIRSFRKFLKQTPWLKYLNFLVKESIKKGPSTANITIVLKPLNNLECLSLQLKNCNPRMTFFSRTLKHISLEECGSDITDDVLFRVADSCRQLEHIQIKSNGSPKFDSISLTYLLKKVEGSLRTLILSIPNFLYPVFCFSNCPLNLTTLCLKMNIGSYQYCKLYCRHNLTMVPNLENLQFLSLGGSAESELLMSCSLKSLMYLYLFGFFPFNNEELGLYAKFTKLSNFQVLYLDSCDVDDIDELVRFIRDCSSLKVFAWKAEEGYSKKELFELEKLKKESQIKIYLSFTGFEPKSEDRQFPSFPNENFDCLKTFNHLFDEIFDGLSPKYFNCHAPIIKKSKALLSI